MNMISLTNRSTFFFFGSLAILLFAAVAGEAVIRDGKVDPSLSIAPIKTSGTGSITCFAVLPNDKILVAGGIEMVSGGKSDGIAQLLPDGTFDSTFIGRANSGVLGVFPLIDGKILISGYFTQYDGQTRNRIARINSDGSLDQSWNPNFGTDYVQIVAVQTDGKIIVNGNFTSIGGIPRNRLARLNPDGSVDLEFQVGSGITNGGIEKAAVLPDGKILFAGHFPTYNDIPRNGLVRVNSDGSLDTGFVPGITGDSNQFFDMSVTSDGKIYLVGDVYGPRIFRLNPDGAIDSTFATGNLGTNGQRMYSVIAQPDGKAIAGGEFGAFSTPSGIVIKRQLVRFNVNGSFDDTFTAGVVDRFNSSNVGALAIQSDNKVLVGGQFPQLNDATRGGIGRLNPDGTNDPAFQGFLGSHTNIRVFHLFQNGKIFVAGDFNAIGTSFVKYGAVILPDGTLDASFHLDSRVDNLISEIVVQPDGKILLGGYSGDNFFGPQSKGIWRINADGSLDTSFDATIAHLESVGTISIQTDGKILIGGSFTNVNGVAKSRIARLNPNGSLDSSFTPTAGGLSVTKIALQPDGKILVGGSFSSFNGSPIANVVRLNPDGSIDTSFSIGSGANNVVSDLMLLPDNRIYIAGSFFQFNGSSRRSLVRLLPNGDFDPSFKNVRISSGISSIALQSDNKLIIGGDVSSTVDASPRKRILRLLEDGSVDFSFSVGALTESPGSVYVYQVAVQSDGQTLACGQFSNVDGAARFGFVRLDKIPRPTPANFDFDGDGRSDLSVYRPSDGKWYLFNSYQNRGRSFQFGTPEDRPVAVDYDGDYISDIGVFRPSTGNWYLINSSDSTFNIINWGQDGDLPVPSDRDGDGRSDMVIFRPSNNTWYTRFANETFEITMFGQSGDKPVTGDFDGDGAGDIAVFRPSDNNWYIRKSSSGYFVKTWGVARDLPVPADYDGDGTTDIAVFRPSTGMWHRIQSTEGIDAVGWGNSRDEPVPADYDADGKADTAVYRPSTRTWWLNSSAEGWRNQIWGEGHDVPVSSAVLNY